ncbi:hypothetical protein [Nocardioides sp.]|uniref:hypothetical protein n=1 Tax=Nocardioides sp. TaxID=35761 RepID=UPI002B8340BF|nr:hypothetical protein [Nocardioides sp.]HXH78943.1 hypothetical protein [Nocardioides sp.]
MTEHDIATLLRHHVSDEPAYTQTAAPILSRGRRTVRRTRFAISGGAAGLALAAASGLSQLLAVETGPERAVDPAIARPVDAYDVTAMRQTMDEHARPILEESVPNLGTADFVAFDAQLQQLPERYWEKASGLVIRYGAGSPHQISVTLGHARGAADGDVDRHCAEGLDGGRFLECAVDQVENGDVAITTVGALRLVRARGSGLQGWREDFIAVTDEELGSTPVDRLWFYRDVKVVKSNTFVTLSSELVQASDLVTARKRLVVPPDDLVAIGLDYALMMHQPPPGENGCAQWTMPTMDVTCSKRD